VTWALAVASIVLLPEMAAACATCVSSAFGDRTYNWAYLGLIVMPFALTAVVGMIVAARMGWRPRTAVKAWFGELSLFSDRSTRPAAGPHLASPLPRKKHGGST
jgi:hypothetical protein